MTRVQIESLPRAEYFNGYKCPVCSQPLIAYCGRMETIEEHCRILGEDLQGSDFLMLHSLGSSCLKALFVAGVSDQGYLDQIEPSDFVLLEAV